VNDNQEAAMATHEHDNYQKLVEALTRESKDKLDELGEMIKKQSTTLMEFRERQAKAEATLRRNKLDRQV
jgi:hypothetical protein